MKPCTLRGLYNVIVHYFLAERRDHTCNSDDPRIILACSSHINLVTSAKKFQVTKLLDDMFLDNDSCFRSKSNLAG